MNKKGNKEISNLTPFDIVKSISNTKEDLSKREDFKKNYISHIINVALARHIDCIMYINDINVFPYMNYQMQYQYLMNSIRKKPRYKPWIKDGISENLAMIMAYYNINMKKAREALSLLNEKQLKEIKMRIEYNIGGNIKNE